MKILTFGEMMLRLKTPDNERLIQANKFEVSYGGSEANVAVSLALLDDNAAFLTKLPPNLLGDSAEATLLKHHVDTGGIHRGGARMGIYFFSKREPAFVQRMLFTIGRGVHFQQLMPMNLIGKKNIN